MLNDNAKAWVAALRSGEYKQGRLALRTRTGEFCCLGVACELAVKAGVATVSVENETALYHSGDQTSPAALPRGVRDWLGLRDSAGLYNVEQGWRRASLMEANDVDRKTFTEIADLIESEPDGMFVK